MIIKLWRNRIVALIISLGLAALFNYLAMPAWNIQSEGLWFYFINVLLFSTIIFLIAEAGNGKEGFLFSKITGNLTILLFLAFFIVSIPSWEVFRASTYSNIVSVSSDGNFDKDIPRVNDSNDIPVVDMLTARKLGDRTMGTMEKYLSQYEVNAEYNLISYQGTYFRISPMEYGGLFKYNNSKKNGIPGYVLVNIYTQEAKMVELAETMKYSPSAHFGDLLKRHLRSIYPTYIFEKEQFEIDDNGVPYFIVPVEKSTAGLFGARVVEKVILVNAVTGETSEKAISEVPEWVDHVFSVNYLMERVDWHYNYINGFINSFTTKKDVRKTSYSFDNSQYYFIAKEDGIYLYTGITSAGNDESNVGFILANVRTGKITYYSNPGSEESSAQASAQGVVQQYGYQAGPVMLVNIDGIETYFMTLKDNQMLVKKYALVNKENYTIAIVEDSVEQAVSSYRAKFASDKKTETVETTGSISELYTAIKNGNTNYYFKLQNDSKLYVSSIENNDQQVIMKIGDTVNIRYVLINDDTAIVQNININK